MNEHDRHHAEKEVLDNMHWKYSETMIDHAKNPRNMGSLPKSDGFAQNMSAECGDTLSMWVSIQNNTITRATFWTNGCAPTLACGSVTTTLAAGLPIQEAKNINKNDILKALGGLPEAHVHCAEWTAETLHMAIEDYLQLAKIKGKRGKLV
ncbi:MAG: iron-sulfur cluster assembly scaffold protein [Peptococcaceae bacterium]|nr:iron-sulfur cluster assembly scaffold protein [Candidatus Syntrophopropionicum ammoniitolerans]